MTDTEAALERRRDAVRELFPPDKQAAHLAFIKTLEHAHRSGTQIRVETLEEFIRKVWRRTVAN